MKKLLALLMTLLFIFVLITTVCAESPTPGTVYRLDFEGDISYQSSRIADMKELSYSGRGSFMYKAYSDALKGGRDAEMQHFNADKSITLPAGEYEITFWTCDPSNMVQDKATGGAKIIMTFHDDPEKHLFDENINPAECGRYTDPTMAVAYKELVDISGGQYLVDATGKTATKHGETWTQYTFRITLPKNAACANFYVLQPEACTTHVDEVFLIDAMAITLLSVAEVPEETEPAPAPTEPDSLYSLDFEKSPVGHISSSFGGTEDVSFSGKTSLFYKAYAHPLPGGRDIEPQYFNGDRKKVIPAGTYTVTFWAADPDNMVEAKPDGRAKIIMTFHTTGQGYLYQEGKPLAECGQYTNPEKAAAYQELVDFHTGQYLVEATGKREVKDGLTWKQYVFHIRFPEAITHANFYVQQPWACTTHTDSLFLIDLVEITPADPSVIVEPDGAADSDLSEVIVKNPSAVGNLVLVSVVILAGIAIGAYIMISERKKDEQEAKQ